MRLENEHTHYRSRFVMFADNQKDEVAPYVLQVIYDWICGKEIKRMKGGPATWLLKRLKETTVNYHADHPDLVSTGCYTSQALIDGMQVPASYDGGAASGEDAKLCSLSFAVGAQSGFPKYWAMDYDEPDGGFRSRRWHTNVGIVSEGSCCVVNVRITNYLVPGYVGNPPSQPKSTTPNFVRRLVALEGFRTQVGNVVLGERPIYLTAQNYHDFLKMLPNDHRELPLIVVASDYEGRLPTDARDLAYKVLGMARVFVFRYSDPVLRDLERRFFVKGRPSFEFRCRPGYVRVYRPHVRPSSKVDSARHRFFGPDDIGRGRDAFNDMLSRSLTRAWLQDDDDVVDVLDVRSLIRRERNAELRERLERLSERSREASSARRARRDADHEANATIDELRQLLAERDRTIDELQDSSDTWEALAKEYASDLEGVSAEADEEHAKIKAELAGYVAELAEKDSTIAELEYKANAAWAQIGSLNEGLSAASHALEAFQGISHVPDRLSELLDLLPALYPARVCVLEEARKSARDFDGRYDLDDELAILKSIPTVLWELYYGQQPSGNVQKDFQDATGFELALTEGSMTNKGSKYTKQRIRVYHGEEIYVYPHIKGRSHSGKDAFRLHYYADNKRRIIVVGHCGEHLDTAGTSKVKH